MDAPHTIDRAAITRMIQQKIAEIPELGAAKVLFENPAKEAAFPVCVLSGFMARPRYFRHAYALSITAEVWATKYYDAQGLYDQVARKLAEMNFTEVSPTPQGKDAATGKNRYGSSFECGWNAVTNAFYTNRR